MPRNERLQRPRTRIGRVRDGVAVRLANLALKIATPWYRAMVSGAIMLGLETATTEESSDEDKRKAWHEGFCVGERSGAREFPLNPHNENPY